LIPIQPPSEQGSAEFEFRAALWTVFSFGGLFFLAALALGDVPYHDPSRRLFRIAPGLSHDPVKLFHSPGTAKQFTAGTKSFFQPRKTASNSRLLSIAPIRPVADFLAAANSSVRWAFAVRQ
jgi:hypothetical protein